MTATNYILGVDGGGTKTVARLMNTSTGQSWQSHGGPSSLSFGIKPAVNSIVQQGNELARRAGIELSDISLVAGLAGACDSNLSTATQQALQSYFYQVETFSDAKTSAWGANQGKPVAVVALGTGSVAMTLDRDGKETLIGGWGLLAGDEGSGAKFGLNAVNALLWELDSRQPLSPTAHYITTRVGDKRSDILHFLRSAKSTDFATLLPAIWSLHTTCSVAETLVQQHTQAVLRLINTLDKQLPLMLIGGLAKISIPLLPKGIQQRVQPALGNSLDGACLLAQHLFASPMSCYHTAQAKHG
ncbi:BadF/BadG/BcrA/BcrD ATPase family protein [Alkalimonas collagenimarina]|uniref:BadF/BadG/BcrA/BcrD ATPase family protein n=1 Tax=Alkalimonas collagenimarina TaxID=400390 RepID=A0ABT9GZ26_9GAMM|nr:BadF/BadG/BcrA/BcrD ATPase family protein [Alkalimonas collagenimarina]MDP4536316.1 BadF/BadG/BcrA/BcrD ATPase family protein [Alkalimonas collagenimarina]